MNRVAEQFPGMDEKNQEIYLLLSLLPPPISLDVLCAITDLAPVRVLQLVEALVKAGYLHRYLEKGAGYYYLSDPKAAGDFISRVPAKALHNAARRAIAGVCDHLPDDTKRWLSLAYVYQVSGLPVRHFKELVQAGHYCLGLNLPIDAAAYYRMVLDAMETETLDPVAQETFIDATVGLCTCRDTALSKDIQRKFLGRSLEFCATVGDPVRKVRLMVLIAKTYIKTARADEANEYLEQAWQMLADHDFPADVRVQVALANSEVLFWQGYITKAIERYESAIGNHEELPADVETLKSCIRLGWIYGIAGETARGVGLIRAVRRKARELCAPDLERYATLILVVVLAEAARIDEGEAFLDEIFSTPTKFLDPYTLWPGNGKRAYFAYCRGEYEKAFEYQKQAYENSKALGTPHHRGPDNLEVMLALEERGMVHPEWNFKSDVKRLLGWPDIYMKGVAFRFRALKTLKEKGATEAIEADLKESIALLTRAGARVELAHAQTLMARIRIGENKIPVAEKLLKSAWEVFSKVNPALFPPAIVIMRFRFVPAWQFDQFFEKFSSGYDQKVKQNCTQLASR
ncbi:hypothetical protein [Desulfosarcina ovata]|uniref:MalT-like TPR region domain-containing protein n=1 Tax=Desulfosarcina ovata subsp. ovata TaxID=2752305 RepID=A0A5K8AFH6_9BACT|nr:hypothetical protein [Desulfosarcina ovata]BBO91412.1 hypothetical protein DSCOOX_45920 [Desulfosarcina ovata subsp. ovata]